MNNNNNERNKSYSSYTEFAPIQSNKTSADIPVQPNRTASPEQCEDKERIPTHPVTSGVEL